MVSTKLPDLIVADVHGWREWLGSHHEASPGVWLVLAKKGSTEPTALTYDPALDEALCQGWIDGRLRRRDEDSYYLRFTPRKARSLWSARNVGNVSRLISEGRMQPAGMSQVERARADGRWTAAYSGQATIEVPADLDAALARAPGARAMFDILTRQNRYAVVYRVENAKRPQTRARRIGQFVAKLAHGETPYPQKRTHDK